MLKFRVSDWLDDWYVLEGTGTWTCIEGNKEEMLGVAKAIREKAHYWAARCCVDATTSNEVRFACPASQEEDEGYGYEFTDEDAVKLAKEIEDYFGG